MAQITHVQLQALFNNSDNSDVLTATDFLGQTPK